MNLYFGTAACRAYFTEYEARPKSLLNTDLNEPLHGNPVRSGLNNRTVPLRMRRSLVGESLPSTIPTSRTLWTWKTGGARAASLLPLTIHGSGNRGT
ncbi:hypothetical protein AVEN_68105-1 [Araneus ventricosus]|uniref:Uncharacterized protein n=1 Tax=Araneus ventricosus TaxID=182803 RepID=A0A4Y2IZ37_ARAVE|nr:hypothetical protein AVEN_68105-1 [Araneus ventricosus]